MSKIFKAKSTVINDYNACQITEVICHRYNAPSVVSGYTLRFSSRNGSTFAVNYKWSKKRILAWLCKEFFYSIDEGCFVRKYDRSLA